jgi:hypothetical protein
MQRIGGVTKLSKQIFDTSDQPADRGDVIVFKK